MTALQDAQNHLAAYKQAAKEYAELAELPFEERIKSADFKRVQDNIYKLAHSSITVLALLLEELKDKELEIETLKEED